MLPAQQLLTKFHAEIPNYLGWKAASGYNHVENKMVVWKTEYHYQLGAVNKANGNYSLQSIFK